MAQVVGKAAHPTHERRVDVEIDREAKALLAGDVQHGLEVLFRAVALAPPVHDKGIDPSPLGLLDLAGHGAGIVRVVEGLGQVGNFAALPGVAVEPGVVEGEDQPFALGLCRWGVLKARQKQSA